MAEPNLNTVSDMDQYGAHVQAIAPVVAAYYEGLVRANVPTALAVRLTCEWHWLLWHRIQYPETPPATLPITE
jgi:hypothetical protein